jgi:putative ABC transport system permease protein
MYQSARKTAGALPSTIDKIFISFDLNLMEPVGDIRYIYIFSAIALFMLMIACINFMNLSTASASKRAREVGIRKVLGSLQRQLVRQFLVESFVLSVIALLFALGLVYWVLPFFNHFSGKNLHLNLYANPWMLPVLLLLVWLQDSWQEVIRHFSSPLFDLYKC